MRDRLREYNTSRAGSFTRHPVAVFARIDDDDFIGAISGEVFWGWLYIDLLWVHEDWRKQGVGSELMRHIEERGDDFDVIGYHLGTTSFQALDFYRKCGYEVWGQLENFPPGFRSYSLYKRR